MSENNLITIEYREVSGFPGYRVGNDGSVWSCLVGKGRLDSVRHGTSVCLRRGEFHPSARFTDHQEDEIRALRLQGLKQREIAKQVGTTRETVSAVLNGHVRTRKGGVR